MAQDWQTLTRLTGKSPFTVERVRLSDTDIAVEGRFELPPLACLASEDQVFVAAFVRCHGSIKEMERMFGVSYPTIKNRLNRIGAQLDFVDVNPQPSPSEVLDALDHGDISVSEALERLGK